MLPILLWIIVGLMILGALMTISQVGKPRPVTTPTVAVIATLLSAFFITVIVAAAVTLSS